MIHIVDVVSSDSSTSGTSAVGDSDGAGESAVGDSVGAKRGRKRLTMRTQEHNGEAAVGASRGIERIQKHQGEAAVSPSRGSEHKPTAAQAAITETLISPRNARSRFLYLSMQSLQP